ncbi:MAG: hypothetical protein AUH30_03465 [Candidatus Rokubacteria bacterium 13_1_40CM_68_15]|nr:MAG: hypothetical protein AUH30_03465 [Candidatus Rokubacteria bacterium 13_1_40CM_68_15]
MTNSGIKRSIVAASMFCVLSGSTASAQPGASSAELEALRRIVQDVIKQNEELRKRVRELEDTMSKRGQAPEAATKPGDATKDPATARATEPTPQVGKSAKDKIQLGGAIEVEVKKSRDFRGVHSSDLLLSTAEFDFEADIVDWAKAELSLQWIAPTNSFPATPDDKITVNEAMITFAKPSVLPFYLKTGRGVVPFGISTGTTVAARLDESLTITGPLTLEIFEAKEDHVLVGYKDHGFNVAAYVYNGDTNNGVREKHLEHYGFAIGYGHKGETLSFDVGIGWIDSVFDTDGLSTAFPELVLAPKKGYTPGIATYVRAGLFGFSFIGEYDSAVREAKFTRGGQQLRTQPEAWQVELGYTTTLFGLRPFAAFNYSKSYQMFAAFPKRRTLYTVGSWLSENIRVALEYNNEQDYNKAHRGTNRDSDTATLRLTYEW